MRDLNGAAVNDSAVRCQSREEGLLHSPIDQMDPPFDREKRLFLSSLRDSRAENALRAAQVTAPDYTWRGCGPSKPPRGF